MDELPLFLLNTVLFPAMPLALHIFEERYKQLIGRCVQHDVPFGVVLIREGSEVGAPAVPFEVGTSAQIVSLEKLEEGRMNLIAVGRRRFRLVRVEQELPYLVGQVEYTPHRVGDVPDVRSAASTVRRLFGDYLRAMATLVSEELELKDLPSDDASLAYAVATALQVDNEVKQELLTLESVQQILQSESQLLPREITRLRLLLSLEQERKRADDNSIGSFSKN